MDLFTLTIVLSMAAFFVIGNYAGRRVKRLDDYFVAGRRASTLFIVGTLVASVFSSTIFLGEAGFTYEGYMGPYLLFPSTAATGYVWGALLFGRYLRRSEAPTVADFFGQRFNSQRVQQAAGLIIIVALGVYLLVVTQGAALLLADLTSLSYTQSLILAWLSYTIFTIYSGSQGVILTDTLMFLMFTVATVIFVFVVVADLGGVASAVEDLSQLESKSDIAAWHGLVGPGTEWPTPMDYLIWAFIVDIAWAVVYAVGPWQSSRHLMARNEHVVIRAALYTCIIVMVMQIFIYGVGGAINLYNPGITPSETAMIWAARNLVPEVLGAVLLAGIMAAALSSASTFLSLVGFSASNDIVPRAQRLGLKTTRLLMLAAGLVALVSSFFVPPNIFWLTLFIGTVFASSWGPVGLMSIWSKSITADGAFWGMIAGFVFNVGPSGLEAAGLITLPSYLNPTVIGAVISAVTIILVSRRGKVSRAEALYRMRLHRTPQSDQNAKQARRTLIAPLAIMIYGLAMPFIMVNYYVIPYQRGTGQLGADGSINWATGEAIFALSAPFFHVPLGLFAIYIVWRSYHPRARAKLKTASEEVALRSPNESQFVNSR